MRPDEQVQAMLLGAPETGKTALIAQLTGNYFLDEYEPTIIEDAHSKSFVFDGVRVAGELLDTAHGTLDEARAHPNLGSWRGFIIVYAVDDANSFATALALHDAVVERHALSKSSSLSRSFSDSSADFTDLYESGDLPQPRFLLLATKTDLPRDLWAVDPSEARAAAQRWGRTEFFETSARDRVNIHEPIGSLMRSLLEDRGVEFGGPKRPLKKQQSCVIC